eukprot:gene23070-35350_t
MPAPSMYPGTGMPTITLTDGSVEMVFVPSVPVPGGARVDYELNDEAEGDRKGPDDGSIASNVTAFTASVVFARHEEDLELVDCSTGDKLRRMPPPNDHLFDVCAADWYKTYIVRGTPYPIPQDPIRSALAVGLRKRKLHALAADLSRAQQRWASWERQCPDELLPRNVPTEVVTQPVHTYPPAPLLPPAPPIDFMAHPILPRVTVRCDNTDTTSTFTPFLTLNGGSFSEPGDDAIAGTVTVYNLATVFKLSQTSLQLVSAIAPDEDRKFSSVDYNYALLGTPLTVVGVPLHIPADRTKAAEREGQMAAARSRLLRSLSEAEEQKKAAYEAWRQSHGDSSRRARPPKVDGEDVRARSIEQQLRERRDRLAAKEQHPGNYQRPGSRYRQPAIAPRPAALNTGSAAPQYGRRAVNESPSSAPPNPAGPHLRAAKPGATPISSNSRKVSSPKPTKPTIGSEIPNRSVPTHPASSTKPSAPKRTNSGALGTAKPSTPSQAPPGTSYTNPHAANNNQVGRGAGPRRTSATAAVPAAAVAKAPRASGAVARAPATSSQRAAAQKPGGAARAPAGQPKQSYSRPKQSYSSAPAASSGRLDGAGGTSAPHVLRASVVPDEATDRAVARAVAERWREDLCASDAELARELDRSIRESSVHNDAAVAQCFAPDTAAPKDNQWR